VYVRIELKGEVEDVRRRSAWLGLQQLGYNKGGMALQLTVRGRRLLFVNAHLAAHEGRVEERRENYHQLCRSAAHPLNSEL
jgi:hypothetical protein